MSESGKARQDGIVIFFLRQLLKKNGLVRMSIPEAKEHSGETCSGTKSESSKSVGQVKGMRRELESKRLSEKERPNYLHAS